MAYKSKYTGVEVDALLDKIADDNVGSIDSALSTESENPVMNKVIATALDSHDVAIEDLQDNKADESGYYPQLSVGLADNLPDRGDVTEGLLGFRESAGAGNSIEDGTANVQELLGESLVWNQLRGESKSSSDETKSGIIVSTTKGSAMMTITGVYDGAERSPVFYNAGQFPKINGKIGHKYLCSIIGNKYAIMVIYGHGGSSVFSESSNEIITASTATPIYIVPGFKGTPIGTELNETICFLCRDLTQMFGAGNEPISVEEFYARIPMGVDLNAYNEGEVLGVNIKGIKSVNDNAFNGEYAKVLGGREYCADGTITSMGFAKEIGGTTEAIVLDSENKFTPSENGYVYASGTDICIHLVHTGYKDHVYTEHEVSESSFDLTPYFPNGMHGINDMRDSVTKSKATRRIGVVDMGTLNWQYLLSGSITDLMYADMSEVKMGGSVNCARFAASPATENWSTLVDGSICVHATRQRVIVKNPGYTDATAFKAAMAGVMLYYELATPIETEIDPQLNMNYKVWDFGTEELLTDSKSAPVLARIIYGFNATDTIRGNKAKNDEQDARLDDIETTMVQKTDYAPALTAGFADNLVSKDVVVDSEFNLRRSGGGAISDGVARMEVVKGNSVVYNQQLRPLLSSEWYISPNYASTEYSGNYCKLTVAQEASALHANGVAITATTTNRKPALPNHAYLITAEIKVSVAISVGIRNYTSPWGGDYRKNAQANQWTRVAFIDKLTELYNGYVIVGTTTNIGLSIGDTIEIRNVAVVDLTQMFGAGNEPTTIEEFYARKPIVEDEYAYNEGEVIHCNVDAVKSVGRNVWDEEVGEGYYSESGVYYYDENYFMSSEIPCLPNTQYYIFLPVGGANRYVAFFDSERNFISRVIVNSYRNPFTTPINARYLVFSWSKSSYNGSANICINLSDPDFNGQYEPYKEDVRELPSAIKEVFPNGMMSAGTAHDVAYNDLNKEVGVTEKRIGVVDLGTFPWYKNTDGYGRVLWKAVNLNNLGIVPNNNILCDRYVAQTKGTIYYDAVKGINVNSEANGVCFLYDPQYDDYDETSFKAAMQGVLLYYELAEPIVTEHQEPFNIDYQVTNGGQEQAMATEQTSAFKAEIAYGFNAAAKIKENANEIAQLKATIAQLQAALASMVNENTEEVE